MASEQSSGTSAPGASLAGRRVVVGSDHAGLALKGAVVGWLRAAGCDVSDLGTHDTTRVDYPDFGHRVAETIAAGDAVFGVLVCGTGIGMCMAANKHAAIRAAVCSEAYSATMTRAHNDANVLCLGERVVGLGLAESIVQAFVTTPFEGGRHTQRVSKIAKP